MIDHKGRHIPERYLAGLPPALRERRVRELMQSRDAYKMGDFSELPTDRDARKMGLVKPSTYTTEAKARGIEYRGDFHDMATRVFRFYSDRPTPDDIQQFAEALRQSFAKGLAAWKSGGHRPGATAQNWAVARVNSLVVGGKTSWTADKKLFAVLPTPVRERIDTMRLKKNPADDLHGRLDAFERIAAPNSGASSNEKAMAARLAADIREKLGSTAGASRSASPPPPRPAPPPPPPRPAPPPPKPTGDEAVQRILRENNRKGLDLSGLDLAVRDFSGANLYEANIKGATLTYANLEGANLSGANLSGAVLFKANFERANLTGANFEGAQLHFACLTNANLSGASFEGANLHKAKLEGANLTGALLYGTKMEGVKWDAATKWPAGFDTRNIRSWFDRDNPRRSNPRLQNPADDLHGRLPAFDRLAASIREMLGIPSGTPRSASTPPPPPSHPTPLLSKPTGDETVRRILRENNRTGLDLSELDLTGLDLNNAYLEEANLAAAILIRANLSNANLTIAKLAGAVLRQANLKGANLLLAHLYRANLINANLEAANLSVVNLWEAKLEGANLTDANLKRANLHGANLTNANLRGANLTDAMLDYTNLTGANLTGANLTGAILDGAKMSEVKWDESTRWPDGFNTKPFLAGKGRSNPRRRNPAVVIKGIALVPGADLAGRDLSLDSGKGADLRGANLQGANLFGTDFTGANFEGADLRGADVRAANFTGANLRGALFTGATYSAAMKWPVGFDISAAGGVLKSSFRRNPKQGALFF
jgi:uncharacterized protein YjbI with pentapeptide repeats